ncbi:MAG: hypothetical protein ACOY94_20290 [Bacillota bacterium]
MRRLPIEQCRRCGERHDELSQLVDMEGRWAMTSIACGCGHAWTVIHTAPANLPALRAWVGHGCEPAEGPLTPLRSGPWQQYRLEGVSPALVPTAS